MQQIIEAIKYYQKRDKDLQKAIQKSCQAFACATPAQARKKRIKVELCQEAKNRAYWYVVKAIKESELGPILAKITDKQLQDIILSNGRYVPENIQYEETRR